MPVTVASTVLEVAHEPGAERVRLAIPLAALDRKSGEESVVA
jgi:hypothetical protein